MSEPGNLLGRQRSDLSAVEGLRERGSGDHLLASRGRGGRVANAHRAALARREPVRVRAAVERAVEGGVVRIL